MDKVVVIGITGGSGSGKTTIVKRISKVVKDFVFIPQDNYYKSASQHLSNDNITDFNFDHPDAFDSELLFQHINKLKKGDSVMMPTYDFVNHCRSCFLQVKIPHFCNYFSPLPSGEFYVQFNQIFTSSECL
jgi:uridine kinase